jgi:hypothetical protein
MSRVFCSFGWDIALYTQGVRHRISVISLIRVKFLFTRLLDKKKRYINLQYIFSFFPLKKLFLFLHSLPFLARVITHYNQYKRWHISAIMISFHAVHYTKTYIFSFERERKKHTFSPSYCCIQTQSNCN